MRRSLGSSFGSMAALAIASAGCSAPVTGELMVAIQTDMAVPKDLDRIELQVLSGGNIVIPSTPFPLGPGEFQLPATQGLTVSEDPSREISIRVRAMLGDWTRVTHTVLTTVPEGRVATLWVPLHFLCSAESQDQGEARDAGRPGACPDDPACAAGACGERRVSSASLPDYVERDVLHRACFDAATCFAGVPPVEAGGIDEEDCTIAAREGDVNVAIATEGDGGCGAAGCFVPLDAESELGWRRRDDGRIALPRALCSSGRLARLGVVVAPVTPACPPKQIGDPLCPADERRPVVLAARQRSPGSLAVSQGGVFWTEQGTLRDVGEPNVDGAVKRVAGAGGAPATLAPAQALPRHLALGDNGEVFWTNRGVVGATATALMRWVPGGKAEPLLDAQRLAQLDPSGSLEALATNGDVLVWTQLSEHGAPGRVGFAELDMLDAQRGATPTELVDADRAYRIVAANNVVCWTDVGPDSAENEAAAGSVRCAKGRSVRSVSVGERKPYGIALDAENPKEVFWVNLEGEVVRAPLDGGARDVIFRDLARPGPYGIALDEHRVYWTNRIEGTVNMLPRDALPDSPCRDGACTLATGQLNPGAIVVDADALYWINEGSPVVGSTGNADGAVVRLAKPPPP
ncbi:hypothetical protein [Sorangium sp. So ce1153]|uniref:hypothetical protein n=1 Tax=Sorangium sp. So ce1153 TaxID=3133333 RepID=UPI003F6338F1